MADDSPVQPPSDEGTAETPEERRARWQSVGAVRGTPGSTKVVMDDGTPAEREFVRHEVDGGIAGWHDKKPDGTMQSTITPHLPGAGAEATEPTTT